MAKFGEGGDLLKCSFCGKSQKQVKKLIAGPGVYICDECIELCNEIIEEELSATEEIDFTELPKPVEILRYLDDYVVGQLEAKKALADTTMRAPFAGTIAKVMGNNFQSVQAKQVILDDPNLAVQYPLTRLLPPGTAT